MDGESLIKDIVYKRKNGENIVNDPEAIKSCKNEQNRDIIDNARLGSYDKFGNYIIIPDIKSELIALPKLVYAWKTNGNSTVYELRSKLPIFGDLFFKLTIDKTQASLTLTETVTREAGGYNEIYDEVIDALALGKERLPNSIIFRNYNIIEDQADHGQREIYLDCKNILTRKVYLNLLSKQLKKVSTFDEHDAFNKMISLLKSSGEYGNRVLNDFVARLKDRPGIFEISDSGNYNKAVNEVLLSSLDVTTTKEDKQDPQIHEVYLGVLNARNENIEEDLKKANALVDENYVEKTVLKATTRQEEFEEEAKEEFLAQIASDKVQVKRHLDKPILKQGKESKNTKTDAKEKTKEEKIKSILEKKKKTPSDKKLKAAKNAKATKKLKAKKKANASKKPKKAKVKSAKKKVNKNKSQTKKKAKLKAKKPSKKKAKIKAKKKVKKAKAPQRAKTKAGSLKPAKGAAAKPAAKKKKKNDHMDDYDFVFSSNSNSQTSSSSASSSPNVSQQQTPISKIVEHQTNTVIAREINTFANKVGREFNNLSNIKQEDAKTPVNIGREFEGHSKVDSLQNMPENKFSNDVPKSNDLSRVENLGTIPVDTPPAIDPVLVQNATDQGQANLSQSPLEADSNSANILRDNILNNMNSSSEIDAASQGRQDETVMPPPELLK